MEQHLISCFFDSLKDQKDKICHKVIKELFNKQNQAKLKK